MDQQPHERNKIYPVFSVVQIKKFSIFLFNLSDMLKFQRDSDETAYGSDVEQDSNDTTLFPNCPVFNEMFGEGTGPSLSPSQNLS
jgi:hypothetical protein